MTISAIVTTRRIGLVAASHLEPKLVIMANNEFDSNADTCCLWKNFFILEYTQRTADVYSYNQSITPIEGVPIVNSATAWDESVSNQKYILIVKEALYYGTKLDHSLLNPNQIRHYGLNSWDNPYNKEQFLNIKLNDSVDVTMQTKGTKIYFETRSPSEVELRDCPKLQLTSRNEWNPAIVSLV